LTCRDRSVPADVEVSALSRYVVLRLLDGFFRRWWLLIVPIILFAAIGAASAAGIKSEYQAVGTINSASQTVLSTINSSNPNFGYRTPADVTSSDINQMLNTGEFIRKLAATAGLSTALESGVITADQIRSSVNVSASGQNLVRVAATFGEPQVAQALAQATIDTYIQSQIDTAVSGSDVAIQVFTGLVQSYQTDVDAAQAAFDSYVTEHPTQLDGSYTAADNVQITRLQATLTAAQNKLDDAQSKLDDANLNKAQAQTAITQQLQIIDSPELPFSRQPKVKKMAVTLVMFVAIGGLLSLGALVLTASTDRTLRFPADVQQRLGVPAIAAVPLVRRGRTA
jgi:uncharacterized protein involved in exopolysaccharide biosynthesis